MKGKILMIALITALVVGIALVSCDNGEFPKNPYEGKTDKTALDWELLDGGNSNPKITIASLKEGDFERDWWENITLPSGVTIEQLIALMEDENFDPEDEETWPSWMTQDILDQLEAIFESILGDLLGGDWEPDFGGMLP